MALQPCYSNLISTIFAGVQELDDVTEDEGDDSEHTAIVAYTSDIK